MIILEIKTTRFIFVFTALLFPRDVRNCITSFARGNDILSFSQYSLCLIAKGARR
jgi:hypothetical protein